MALVQAVEDGKLVDTSTSAQSDSSSAKKSDRTTLGKEAFLQLLVTQMKYQDPLEPTSNTEYIAQLATFSQLEELQNVGASMSQLKASGLVGKAVIVKTVSATTGETYLTAGYVDAVIMENGKPFLYVNGAYYSVDDLDSVIEDDYFKEFLKSQGIKDPTVDTDEDKTTEDTEETGESETTEGTETTKKK